LQLNFADENRLYIARTGWLLPSFLLYCLFDYLIETVMYKGRRHLNLAELPANWKRKVAQWVRLPLLSGLLRWVIHLVVPRQRIGVVLVVMNDAEQVLLLPFHRDALTAAATRRPGADTRT
jgi:hypothetical protein